MKNTLTLLLILFSVTAFAQSKPEPAKADTVAIEIPARQLQKISELDKAMRELQARREDILLDLLAVPENAERIKGRRFIKIKDNKIQFAK